jgi:uncharacterized protein (DUF736 family)
MPTIGSFSHDDLFGQEGTLETSTLKAKIKFVPLRDRSGKQPDYRILLGKREVGAAGSRTSKSGGEYLFLKLSDPRQPAPVCCNLYRNASGPAVLWAAEPDGPAPRQASSKPRSVTSLSVRPVTFLSVIYRQKTHKR